MARYSRQSKSRSTVPNVTRGGLHSVYAGECVSGVIELRGACGA